MSRRRCCPVEQGGIPGDLAYGADKTAETDEPRTRLTAASVLTVSGFRIRARKFKKILPDSTRSRAVTQILHCTSEHSLHPSTAGVAVAIFDSYTAVLDGDLEDHEYHPPTVAAACYLIASKMGEDIPPYAKAVIDVIHGKPDIETEDVLSAELAICQGLDFHLRHLTPHELTPHLCQLSCGVVEHELRLDDVRPDTKQDRKTSSDMLACPEGAIDLEGFLSETESDSASEEVEEALSADQKKKLFNRMKKDTRSFADIALYSHDLCNSYSPGEVAAACTILSRCICTDHQRRQLQAFWNPIFSIAPLSHFSVFRAVVILIETWHRLKTTNQFLSLKRHVSGHGSEMFMRAFSLCRQQSLEEVRTMQALKRVVDTLPEREKTSLLYSCPWATSIDYAEGPWFSPMERATSGVFRRMERLDVPFSTVNISMAVDQFEDCWCNGCLEPISEPSDMDVALERQLGIIPENEMALIHKRNNTISPVTPKPARAMGTRYSTAPVKLTDPNTAVKRPRHRLDSDRFGSLHMKKRRIHPRRLSTLRDALVVEKENSQLGEYCRVTRSHSKRVQAKRVDYGEYTPHNADEAGPRNLAFERLNAPNGQTAREPRVPLRARTIGSRRYQE